MSDSEPASSSIFHVDLNVTIRCLGPGCTDSTPLQLEYNTLDGGDFDQLVPKLLPVRKEFQSLGFGWMCSNCHATYTRWLAIRAAETKKVGERIAVELNEKLELIRAAWDEQEELCAARAFGPERKKALDVIAKKYGDMLDSTRAEYGTKYGQEVNVHLLDQKLDTFLSFTKREADPAFSDGKLLNDALQKRVL